MSGCAEKRSGDERPVAGTRETRKPSERGSVSTDDVLEKDMVVEGAPGGPGAQGGARFSKKKSRFAYGLEIVALWADGGKLCINLPEHLEYMPGTRGILRHNDKAPKGHWEVSSDGKTATLDVESSTAPGVFVRGEGRVVKPDRVEITVRITNRGTINLEAIKPLYCFHYRHLTGFPQWIDNFRHCYVMIGGRILSISESPRENPASKRATAMVVGCKQEDVTRFGRRSGGHIEKGIDRAICAVTALDGGRKLVFGWTPGKSLLSNASIPCIHADPFYGDIAPGESKEAKCVILFTEGALEDAFKALGEEGVGAPAG